MIAMAYDNPMNLWHGYEAHTYSHAAWDEYNKARGKPDSNAHMVHRKENKTLHARADWYENARNGDPEAVELAAHEVTHVMGYFHPSDETDGFLACFIHAIKVWFDLRAWRGAFRYRRSRPRGAWGATVVFLRDVEPTHHE